MMAQWTLNKVAFPIFLFALHGLQAGFGQNKSESDQETVSAAFVASHQQHNSSTKSSGEGQLNIDNDSMRALVDISNNDDIAFSYYYDTLDPSYYDIVDYVYIEENETSSVTDYPTSTVSPESSTTQGMETELNDNLNKENDSLSACDPETHFGCNIASFERCSHLTKNCHCLQGYVKAQNQSDPSSCVAADFFRGHLKIQLPDVTGRSLSIQMIQTIEANLTTYLQLLLENENIRDLLSLSMYMPSVTPLNEHGVMSLTFDVALKRGSSGHRHEIREIWRSDFEAQSELSKTLSNLFQVIGWNNSSSDAEDIFSPLVETNPCHNSEHNYCHPHSQCRMKEGTPSCTCQSGFQDVSPDVIQTPGEICLEDCRCENSGVCVKDSLDPGKRQCSCLNWYFGSKCQINGKELLIICCCSLGCLLLVAAIVLCCYYGCVKDKLKGTKTNLFSYAPNANFLKLPRVWMESRTHENEISPCSIRRMNLGSECNPYFDGLILEDLPPSTIQSHRRGDMYAQHYQPQNAGLATVSSHSFFCPY